MHKVVAGRLFLVVSFLHMALRACVQAVGRAGDACAQPAAFTHSRISSQNGCAQSYVVVRRLYQKSTQVVHGQIHEFLSVKSLLYTLSTPPIKTTTNLNLN